MWIRFLIDGIRRVDSLRLTTTKGGKQGRTKRREGGSKHRLRGSCWQCEGEMTGYEGGKSCEKQ